MENVICKNCSKTFEGNFCPQCGQDAHEHRINASSILHDIPHSIFHIDKGFFYTLVKLFTHPGKMLKEYIDGKRVSYFRPLAYVVLMSAIATFIMKGISWISRSIFLKYNPGGAFPESHGFFSHYISIFIFLTIPLTALVTWLFFIRQKYNYWEHIVMNTYIAAQMNIIIILIKLVGLITVLFTHRLAGINMSVFLTIFISGLLYMYGAVYGYIMLYSFKKKWQFFALIILMNFILANIFMNLFVYAGISSPW